MLGLSHCARAGGHAREMAGHLDPPTFLAGQAQLVPGGLVSRCRSQKSRWTAGADLTGGGDANRPLPQQTLGDSDRHHLAKSLRECPAVVKRITQM